MTHYLMYLCKALNDAGYVVPGFGYIMARANNFLNYRQVVGFRVLSEATSKRCEWVVEKEVGILFKDLRYGVRVPRVEKERCGGKAVVGVLMEKGDKKFTVYLCSKHFKEFLYNTVKYVKQRIDEVYRNIMEFVEMNHPFHDMDLEGIEVLGLGGRLNE